MSEWSYKKNKSGCQYISECYIVMNPGDINGLGLGWQTIDFIFNLKERKIIVDAYIIFNLTSWRSNHNASNFYYLFFKWFRIHLILDNFISSRSSSSMFPFSNRNAFAKKSWQCQWVNIYVHIFNYHPTYTLYKILNKYNQQLTLHFISFKNFYGPGWI